MDLSMPLGLKLDIDDTLIEEYQRMFLSKPVSLLNIHDEMFVVPHYVIQQGYCYTCCPLHLGQNKVTEVPTTTTTTTTEYYSELPKVQPFAPVMPFPVNLAELKVVQPEPHLEPQNYSPPLKSQHSASPPRSAVVQKVVPNTNHKEVNKSMTGKIKREKRRNTRVLLPYSQSRKKETNFQAYCADFVLW